MTKQELKQIPKRESIIRHMRTQFVVLQEKATQMTPKLEEKVQTSIAYRGNIYADEAVDLTREAARLQEEQNKAKAEALKLFDALDDPVEYRLMHLRYYKCLDWESISQVLGYSWRHTLRLHGEILLKLF